MQKTINDIIMKKSLIILILFILLLGCYIKEGPNCHYKVLLKNNSNTEVSVGIRWLSGSITLGTRTCSIAENIILPGGIYELPGPLYTCWEDEIRLSGDFEIFVVDPEKTDEKYGFYSCDSIYAYNKILRHYLFTLEEMKARDFIINYPEDEGIEPKD